MKFVRKPKRQEEINMAPLIDMVFILIIFFAVTTTFSKDMQLELQRPGAKSSVPSGKAVRVYLDRGGNAYVDEQPVKAWMVQSRVRDLLAVATSKKVLVVADRLVPSERLIEMVDQCRLGGASEVAVATEAPRG